MSQQELSREVQEICSLFREASNQIREIVKHQKAGAESQPYTIFIQNLRHPSYRLRHLIPILIERDGDTIIATYHDVDIHGTGGNVQEAISDLRTALIKYYETLKDDEANLVPLPSQEYAFLKQIIVEVEAESTETNPWIKYAGMFADDPYFDEFIKGIEMQRKALDSEEYDG